jgi:allantoicase
VTPALDLASRWLGGTVMAASDESFGAKENLLSPAEPAFEPGHYGPHGEIVDGWETRRRRGPGHDWALIRLGAPGKIASIEVDTRFFTGNYPESCRVEACGADGYPSPDELNGPHTAWAEIVPRSALRGDTRTSFPVTSQHRYTHLRLSIFPDGGVARLRAHGQVIPDPRGLEQLTIDLASQEHGGLVTGSSDSFYTSAQLLNRPGQARSMGEGWETRRRRGPGHDYAIIRLAFPGRIHRLIVDTAYFRYNASAAIAVWVSPDPHPQPDSPDWQPLLRETRLQPDTKHTFPVTCPDPAASIRVDAIPDGGLSRVRAIGTISPAARSDAGYRWFNALPAVQAMQTLRAAGISQELATSLAQQRPLTSRQMEATADSDAADILKALLEGRPE